MLLGIDGTSPRDAGPDNTVLAKRSHAAMPTGSEAQLR